MILTVASWYLAADVTSWPRAGVALLIVLVVLLAVVAVVVNLRGAPSTSTALTLDTIAPPLQESEDRELQETYNV